jgi:hypothetical protein
MRIRADPDKQHCFKICLFHPVPDPDPADQNDADLDPQQCLKTSLPHPDPNGSVIFFLKLGDPYLLLRTMMASMVHV